MNKTIKNKIQIIKKNFYNGVISESRMIFLINKIKNNEIAN